jgi:predicted ATPase
MITQLRLKRFKSFANATLELGPFTLLVGTNASGKSNLRDAFRLLHGIGRGYTLAEIIGEKRSEGERIWGGIRGGTRGLAFQDAETFALEVSFDFENKSGGMTYSIEINPGAHGRAPCVVHEELTVIESYRESGFDVVQAFGPLRLLARFGHTDEPGEQWSVDEYPEFLNHQPVLSQCIDRQDVDVDMRRMAINALGVLKNMRFLDPNPDAMRQPAIPGQTILSDRGENLAAVLHAIASNPEQKENFVTWMQMLTPMDVRDLAFDTDPTGRIALMLVEASGQRISAYSASDGTLRFLALLAALLGPQPARFHFFEELETGIHPTRLNLLLNLVEQQTAQGITQIVATTHSPQVLLRIAPETLEHAALTYRLEGHPETRIKQLIVLPDIRRLVDEQDAGRLHDSGWFEDVVEFLENTDDEVREDLHVAWTQE